MISRKDYIIKIIDIVPWRTALREEAEAGSLYAYINEQDEVKLNVPVTGIIARVGPATASICRLSTEEYDWLIALPQVVELGSGSPYIREIGDITWVGQGKGLYHAIHSQAAYNVPDGEGSEISITPPELHCVIAS